MSGLQCCENSPDLTRGAGEGHVQDIGGLKSYLTGSSSSKHAIILVSDVFGFEAPNLRKLADKIAASGYVVAVPDFLRGDYFVPGNVERPVSSWIEEHAPVEAYEAAKPVIEALKEKGATSIGAAGMCWGAKVVVELAKAGHLQAAVLMHPSLVTLEDIGKVNIPISVLAAEIDEVTPPELVKKFHQVLGAKSEIKSLVKIFGGAAHGWTVRYKTDDGEAVRRAEEAHQDMLGWFDVHVKAA